MLKVFILSLLIIIFYSFALILKILFKGEKDIDRADCSGKRSSDPSGCSLCERKTGGNLLVKIK